MQLNAYVLLGFNRLLIKKRLPLPFVSKKACALCFLAANAFSEQAEMLLSIRDDRVS